jgi:class 3 adenylate cyclase
MKICPHCHQENPDQAKFCLGCGTKISPLQKETGSESADQGERRQMTLFFCDLVDSTPLSERMDPEDYRQMILDYHDVAEKVINLHGGKVGNYIGDGLLVYFGYPEGLENSAITAVQTAIAVIEALDEVRRRWEDPKANIYIKIRVGMHTGLVIVDDHLALGETVNLAARLEGLAPHNGIVVSPQTLDLIKGWFKVKSLGEKSLKGISEPVEVYEVTGETGARTRLDISKFKGLSPLVGREDELNRLRKSWALARDGKGSSLMLLGEAGIGKSRLSDKLEAEIQRDPANLLLEARCSMHHTNSAFFPLLEVIETDILSIRASDDHSQRVEKLERFFREHDLGGEEMIPLLA